MRMTPCESTPRKFAHTTPCAQVAAIAGSTPAAVKIAAAKSVRLDLVRRISSVMRDGLSERREPVEPRSLAISRATRANDGRGCALLRGDAGDLDHTGDARDFVLESPSILVGTGAHRLDPGDRELADHVGLLDESDRLGGDLPDDRRRRAAARQQSD